MELQPDHLLQRIQELRAPVREALEVVTRYYCTQLEPEHLHASADELKAALVEIRRALTCQALVAEIPTTDQAHVQVVFGDLLPPPLPIEHPLSRIHHVDVLLQEVSIGLVCWRVRNDASLILDDSDPLPAFERFQHGDLVIVRAADWTSYPYNGCTGTFLRYSDPRIGHHDRWAVVDLGGDPDDAEVFVRPAYLRFAPEEEGHGLATSRPVSASDIEDETCSEAEALENCERLGTWNRHGFSLKLFDTGKADRRGKSILAYELFDENHGRGPVFQGADFHCSPLHDRASDATVADVLGFLSLRPEDSDSERFASYTAKQLVWCEERGADLAVVAEQFEQRQQWRDLHAAGETEEAVLAVARYGQVEDLFEVLHMDIFDAYDLVEDLCRRRDDLDLNLLIRQLHYWRNVELVGGEEELASLYY